MSKELEEQLRATHEERKRVEETGAEQRYLESSRKRLQKIITKKVTTSFIGALAKFEQHFGGLWGHGIPEDQKTEEQLAMAEIWDACRTEVLNNGNNQQRAVENELAQYTVKWNRYQLVITAAKG